MLYDAVHHHALTDPDARAVTTTDGTSTSYGELVALTGRIAGGLRCHGVRPGDVVACSLRNQVGYVAFILAVARIGAPGTCRS